MSSEFPNALANALQTAETYHQIFSSANFQEMQKSALAMAKQLDTICASIKENGPQFIESAKAVQESLSESLKLIRVTSDSISAALQESELIDVLRKYQQDKLKDDAFSSAELLEMMVAAAIEAINIPDYPQDSDESNYVDINRDVAEKYHIFKPSTAQTEEKTVKINIVKYLKVLGAILSSVATIRDFMPSTESELLKIQIEQNQTMIEQKQTIIDQNQTMIEQNQTIIDQNQTHIKLDNQRNELMESRNKIINEIFQASYFTPSYRAAVSLLIQNSLEVQDAEFQDCPALPDTEQMSGHLPE